MNRSANVVKKNVATDRVLVLAPLDGQKPKSSTGLVDPRLFSGENTLHAIKDPQTSLWSLKYDSGGLPPVLKDQVFTSFTTLKKFVELYFKKRNVQIIEVID